MVEPDTLALVGVDYHGCLVFYGHQVEMARIFWVLGQALRELRQESRKWIYILYSAMKNILVYYSRR